MHHRKSLVLGIRFAFYRTIHFPTRYGHMLNHDFKKPSDAHLRPLDDEMTEISFLMPTRQVQTLEQAAHSEGLTVGQYVRRALQQALNQFVLPTRKSNGRN